MVATGGAEARVSRRVASIAAAAHRVGVARASAFDAVVAIAFAVFGAFSVRYVELALRDSKRRVEAARGMLTAALGMGGQVAAEAQRLLTEIDEPPLRLPTAVVYVLALAATLPLARRRFEPMAVAVVVVASSIVLSWYSPLDTNIPVLASWLAIYSLSSHARQPDVARWSVGLAAVTVLVVLNAGVIRRADFPDTNLTVRDLVYSLAFLSLVVGSALPFGEITRQHRRSVAELQAKTALLAAQQSEIARNAVLDERVRIARELHDVVAHHVSVMGVQAGAARLRLDSAPQRDEPVRAALANIEQSSRLAVDDLSRLLGFLRRSDDEAAEPRVDVGPQPTVRDVVALVEASRASGLPVSASIDPLDDVPPGVGLAAYRIVQEALTNVRKHAPACRSVTVDLRVSPTRLDVVVCNDGVTQVGGPANGRRLGLVGMHERAALHGGRMEVGPIGDGSFEVHAELPLRGAS